MARKTWQGSGVEANVMSSADLLLNLMGQAMELPEGSSVATLQFLAGRDASGRCWAEPYWGHGSGLKGVCRKPGVEAYVVGDMARHEDGTSILLGVIEDSGDSWGFFTWNGPKFHPQVVTLKMLSEFYAINPNGVLSLSEWRSWRRDR